jgi:hypothetical protein
MATAALAMFWFTTNRGLSFNQGAVPVVVMLAGAAAVSRLAGFIQQTRPDEDQLRKDRIAKSNLRLVASEPNGQED